MQTSLVCSDIIGRGASCWANKKQSVAPATSAAAPMASVLSCILPSCSVHPDTSSLHLQQQGPIPLGLWSAAVQERRIAELESQLSESQQQLEAAQSNRTVTLEALDQVRTLATRWDLCTCSHTRNQCMQGLDAGIRQDKTTVGACVHRPLINNIAQTRLLQACAYSCGICEVASTLSMLLLGSQPVQAQDGGSSQGCGRAGTARCFGKRVRALNGIDERRLPQMLAAFRLLSP